MTTLPELSAAWQRQRHAFDARPRRERALLIGALCALALFVGNMLWLGPALKSWNEVRKQIRQADTAMAQWHDEQERLKATGQAQEAQLRQDLAQWRARVREHDGALRDAASQMVGADRMLPLLEQLLSRNGQVRVRSLQSLGKTDLAAGDAPASAAPARADAAASAPSKASAPVALYRHGVELTLEGRYVDLLGYVQSLEAAPQRLLWGGMQFKVEQYPRATLTLRLYTLSLDRHWLEI